ncbi:hypothetical protein [Staphylococcus phage vB_StaM_SA1]|nr:hypothetical protein [Staphylococcus phage vB_StaM_SA1]
MLNNTNKLSEMEIVQKFNKMHYQLTINNGEVYTEGPDIDLLNEIKKDIGIMDKRIKNKKIVESFN